MKRLSRKLTLALAVLFWVAALLYLLLLSRRKVSDLETEDAQDRKLTEAEWDDLLDQFEEKHYLSVRRWKPGQDPYRLYAFNQRECERIPSNRALRDTRHYRCSALHYGPELPPTSIIITFHNEARSTLLRTVRSLEEMVLWRTVLKKLTGLLRALTSTPSNTFGINWKVNCQPGLIAQSVTDLTNALLAKWKQIPVAMLRRLV